jgi:hypothetical protein
MHAACPPVTDDTVAWCCAEFRSAVEVAFAMPVNGPTGWLLYGTDAETVGAGLPELRYWAVQYCPFCGARLQPYPGDLPRGRAFGFDKEMTDNHGQQETGQETGERRGPANE